LQPAQNNPTNQPTHILPRPGNVNFCKIKIDKGYEPEVEKEKAFETPDKAEERYRFILPDQKLQSYLYTSSFSCKTSMKEVLFVIDQLKSYDVAKDIMSLRANETIEQMLLYPNQKQKLAKNQVTKILISYDENYLLFEVEENEDNRMFNKFKYKDEVLDKAEDFYTSKVSNSDLFDNLW
ncbi:24997_t:CDS:2, partial [Racocetra persica]